MVKLTLNQAILSARSIWNRTARYLATYEREDGKLQKALIAHKKSSNSLEIMLEQIDQNESIITDEILDDAYERAVNYIDLCKHQLTEVENLEALELVKKNENGDI